MKRLIIAGVLLLSTQASAFETEAGCKKMIFKGTTEEGTRVEFCILTDGNFHYNQYDTAIDDEHPRVHFDVKREAVKFSSVGGYYDYREAFTFVENDLTYLLYNHINEDDEICPLVSVVAPGNESVIHDYIIPTTFDINYDISDIRGLTK